MTVSCPDCHRDVRPQSRFCPYCGVLLARRLDTGSALNGGNYHIVRSLSKGGMGAVYLASDHRAFDRVCVIKQMLEYYDTSSTSEREHAQQRFEEEGRTLATLSHPGVPKIFAFFVEGGRFYIVMEYIKGANLESFVTHENERGDLEAPTKRLPREEVIRYTIQVCRILEYLHALSHPVVHQDIKPANIILEAHLGEVRLVDFGTARVELPADAVLDKTRPSVYGTEGYAPPEQYKGHPVPRSDVYALAASAYHLMTDDDPRTHPFQFPRLERLPREVSIALERALRPDPNQRSSAVELLQALESQATPTRMLQAFTFPGGVQIRSVGALPALCDEHWDAARSFLYNGDFTRWLRDLNRLDLVVAVDGIVKGNSNHDAGLEQFVRTVDSGIAKPKMVTDPPAIELGSVARDAALSRNMILLNATRGYTQAQVSTDQSWLEVFPASAHLWSGKPVKIRVSIHAEGLPLRKAQSGNIKITLADQEPIIIPLRLQVSIVREVWRLTRRALAAAIPEAWRLASAGWLIYRRTMRFLLRPFKRFPWLVTVLWVLLSTGTWAVLYLLPDGLVIRLPWLALTHPSTWQQYVLPVALGPPVVLLVIWATFLVFIIAGGALIGAIRGAWKSFTR
ncbi:MAG: serine/threonine-protein kinase [Anaerolineae bacterium]